LAAGTDKTTKKKLSHDTQSRSMICAHNLQMQRSANHSAVVSDTLFQNYIKEWLEKNLVQH